MSVAVPVVLIQVSSCKEIFCEQIICLLESLECATIAFKVSKFENKSFIQKSKTKNLKPKI